MSILLYSMLFACSGDKADDTAVVEEPATEPAEEPQDTGSEEPADSGDTAEDSGGE
jgi:hypothetical protein